MRKVLTVFFISYLSSLSVQADETVTNTQPRLSVASQVRIVVKIPLRTQLSLDTQQLKAQVNTKQGAVVSKELESKAGEQQIVYTATSL
jgi:hypothetical protein